MFTGSVFLIFLNAQKPLHHLRRSHPMQFHDFVPRGVAAHQFHPAVRAIKFLGQQSQQRLVRGSIYWRRGHLDAQFFAKRPDDFIG